MTQSRTHTCNQLRIENVGEKVKIVGWMENVREVGQNFAFVIVRDFYGTTQVVVETEDMMKVIKGINKESTISVEGTVRERARSIRFRSPRSSMTSCATALSCLRAQCVTTIPRS